MRCSRKRGKTVAGIRKIVFNFPVPVDGEEVKELPLETETTVETVALLSRVEGEWAVNPNSTGIFGTRKI